MLTIKNEYPPNYAKIQLAGLGGGDTFYCYDHVIYNPSGLEITPDIIFHESIHEKQQEQMGADAWWDRYLQHKEFRYQQEIQAYSQQYLFIKTNLGNSAAKEALTEMGFNLRSPVYGLQLKQHEVERDIRRQAQ